MVFVDLVATERYKVDAESSGRTSREKPSQWELMRTIFGSCEGSGSGPGAESSLRRLTGWLAG
jgi:hypothetical protein